MPRWKDPVFWRPPYGTIISSKGTPNTQFIETAISESISVSTSAVIPIYRSLKEPFKENLGVTHSIWKQRPAARADGSHAVRTVVRASSDGVLSGACWELEMGLGFRV